jgi:hypothetical protein
VLNSVAFSFQQCPFDDASTDMMVTRFKNRLWKKFSLDMKVIGEEQYIDDADIRELYQFIGVLAPGHTDIVSLDDIRHTSNPVGREPLRCATQVICFPYFLRTIHD